MSNLWWLSPDWKKAECPECGRNIWDSGGDPDMGICFECHQKRYDDEQRQKEYYEEQEREYYRQ
jgi:hypothetical protein